MLIRIVYRSTATGAFFDQQLEELAVASQSHNKGNNITGVLIYTGVKFVQVLEGEAEVVDATYKRIQSDTRHSGIQLMFRGAIEDRMFGDWAMMTLTVYPHSARRIVDLVNRTMPSDVTEVLDEILNVARRRV